MNFDIIFLQIWNLKMTEEKPKDTNGLSSKDNPDKLCSRNYGRKLKKRKLYFYWNSTDGGDGNAELFSEMFKWQNCVSPSQSLHQWSSLIKNEDCWHNLLDHTTAVCCTNQKLILMATGNTKNDIVVQIQLLKALIGESFNIRKHVQLFHLFFLK